MSPVKAPFTHVPQVGAPDRERKNSLIQGDPSEALELIRQEAGDTACGCYFNDRYYNEGAYVLSGTTYLRCEGGIWVETGTSAPVPP